jgi:hypothetical protein
MLESPTLKEIQREEAVLGGADYSYPGGSSDIENRVYSLIKRRLLENAVGSALFFPGLGKTESDRLLSRPSVVEKHPVGAQINLCDKAYILFYGRVRISPPMLKGCDYEVASYGSFSREAIIGIKTKFADPLDGEFAEVKEECVTISIIHKELFDIMQNFKEVEEAWDAIWGRRYNNLMRLIKDPVSRVPQTSTAN